MSRLSIATVVAASLLCSSAVLAADLPNRKAPAPLPALAPAFTWTGVYVGVNAGYGFGRISKAGVYFKDPAGFVGGGQVGYNYQFAPNLVLGIETDLQYADMRAAVNAPGRAAALSAGTKNGAEWFGTVRPRVGYAMDRALFYVTGGLAYGTQKLSVPGLGSGSATNVGYALGGGVEYAFTSNITGKIEGLYVDLTDHNYVATTPVSTKSGTEFSVVRAGVNYKF